MSIGFHDLSDKVVIGSLVFAVAIKVLHLDVCPCRGLAVNQKLTAESIAGIVGKRPCERNNFSFNAGRLIPAILIAVGRDNHFRVMHDELVFRRFPIRLGFNHKLINPGTRETVVCLPRSLFKKLVSLE